MRTRDLDRHSPEQAREVLEACLPNATKRDAMLRCLASSIRKANEISPQRWTVSLFPDRVRVNVGWVEVMVVSTEPFFNIVVDGPTPKPVVGVRSERADYKAFKGNGWRLTGDVAGLQMAYSATSSEHTRAIEIAARRAPPPSTVKAHSPGVLLYLEQTLDEVLPRPGKSTFLLTWNATRWEWRDLEDAVRDTASGKVVSMNWSAGNRKNISAGDRVFLIRLGEEPRGIIASGTAHALPERGEHWDDQSVEGASSLFVECAFDRVVVPEAALPYAALKRDFPNFGWSPQASGVRIPEAIASRLESVWAKHLGATEASHDLELVGFEGQTRERFVRHRQREQRLRNAKIDDVLGRTGRLACQVRGCGFDFEATYGLIGKRFAHVHHLKPLASQDGPRETRLEDLAVVCANCHAMIHTGGECRPLEGLFRRTD